MQKAPDAAEMGGGRRARRHAPEHRAREDKSETRIRHVPARMRRVTRWLAIGEWRAHPVRGLTAIAAIAIGVALGFAIHLVNAAALNEFTTAVHSLSGQADIQVSGTEAMFDEALYPILARLPEVAVASPVLEFDASLPGAQQALKIIGLDVFRAG